MITVDQTIVFDKTIDIPVSDNYIRQVNGVNGGYTVML